MERWRFLQCFAHIWCSEAKSQPLRFLVGSPLSNLNNKLCRCSAWADVDQGCDNCLPQISSMLVKMISAIIECINRGSATLGDAEQGWALAREGLSALERVLKQAPSSNRAMQDRSITSLKGGHGWLPLLITCIVSPDAEVCCPLQCPRITTLGQFLCALPRNAPHFLLLLQTRRCAHAALAAAEAVLSGVDKEAIEDVVVPRLGQLLPWITEKTASGKEGESWDGLRAWDAIVALAGERMVRGGQINQVRSSPRLVPCPVSRLACILHIHARLLLGLAPWI